MKSRVIRLKTKNGLVKMSSCVTQLLFSAKFLAFKSGFPVCSQKSVIVLVFVSICTLKM